MGTERVGRLPYETPALVVLGSLLDVTLASLTGSVSDGPTGWQFCLGDFCN